MIRSTSPARIESSKSALITTVIWSGAEWTVRTWPTPTMPGWRAADARMRADQLGIGGFADQQRLRFDREQQGGEAEDDADDDRGGAVEQGVAGELRQRDARPRRRGCRPSPRRLEQDDEGGRVLRAAHRLEPAKAALGEAELPERGEGQPPSSRKATEHT